MNRKYLNILNAVLFKLVWWSTVMFKGMVVLPVVLIYFFHIFVVSEKKIEELRFTVILALVGILFDSIFLNLGLISFSDEVAVGIQLLPWWMMTLWLAFSTTVNHSFAVMFKSKYTALIIGLFTGPLTYWGASRLGALEVSTNISLFVLCLGVFWGGLFYGLALLKKS